MNMNYVSFPGLGIIDLPVSRVAFNVFGLPIYWYGILIATAVLLCVFLGMRHAPRFGLTPDDVLDVVIAVIPLAIVFARLYYVVFSPTKWTFLTIIDVRNGGLAFYGGVIGGLLGLALVARLKRIRLHRIVDFLVVYLPLGQAIGRWGNFFNQEAFGNNTTLPWGMKSAATQAYLESLPATAGLVPANPVHPTFLYEFLANILIFVILLVIRKRSRQPYETTFAYLGMYGFVRFFVESIRTDPLTTPLFGVDLRVSMWLSALMVIASVVVLWILRSRAEKRAYLDALQEAAVAGSKPDTDTETADKDGDGSAGA
jgi:phosphatidylglycerol:prolipoprotein diacylglycerol transferase